MQCRSSRDGRTRRDGRIRCIDRNALVVRLPQLVFCPYLRPVVIGSSLDETVPPHHSRALSMAGGLSRKVMLGREASSRRKRTG